MMRPPKIAQGKTSLMGIATGETRVVVAVIVIVIPLLIIQAFKNCRQNRPPSGKSTAHVWRRQCDAGGNRLTPKPGWLSLVYQYRLVVCRAAGDIIATALHGARQHNKNDEVGNEVV